MRSPPHRKWPRSPGRARATEAEFWSALFRSTYAAELRVEPRGRAETIVSNGAAHFGGLLPLAWQHAGIAFEQRDGLLAPHLAPARRLSLARWWRRRRRLGKLLNLTRLVRATTTFDGAARYAAWKIERHAGIVIPLTPWRERHPLLSAPVALWAIWRHRVRAAPPPG